MRIEFRFLGVDISPETVGGEIELPDGATVADALAAYARQHELGIPIGRLTKSIFLVDSTPARLDRVLCDGEKLTVIRTLAGG